MASQQNLKKFNNIYDKTYSDLLKYVIIKCHNVNDANDIVQEVYFEFWKILNKKEISDSNIKSFLIGIANNKIKKHYKLIQKIKTISLFNTDNNENENDLIENIGDSTNVESLIIEKDEWDNIWNYIKNKKNQNIPKIFYLYYVLELTIKEISKDLDVSESYVKNIIYRTLKELCSLFGKECN